MKHNKLGYFVFADIELRIRKKLNKTSGPKILKSRCWVWKGACIGGGRPVIRPSGKPQRRLAHIMLELDGRPRPSKAHMAAHLYQFLLEPQK